MKRLFEDQIQALADETGYDVEFLMAKWNDVQDEAHADGEPADWDQFCGITRDLDW